MATIRAIARVGAPVLRQVAREVSPEELATPEIQGFIDDLVATMRHANGAGLAANQVFEPIQICALEVQSNPRYPYKPNIPLTVLVNPKLTPLGDDSFANYEGCLSVPDLRGVVRRHARLRVQALDREGNSLDFETAGVTAGTYQHEVDHLRGKLFLDRVEDPATLCTWDNFKRHHEDDFRRHVEALVERWGS
ncbi:putative polypeptide deformylase protein [Plesiocystis pacifica SIR-1]|uniref:Peptide deformylase n=1 Tax=Plesiocystis pacifica SIR-1 TaxID=391625 RepID=A6G3Q1_9BACT|nr:peptide deformylase [Plesiocystis pacifica]EDM79438.1 putative polypeptide deformylase protein [Plesiocystis pacifica SIR-1]